MDRLKKSKFQHYIMFKFALIKLCIIFQNKNEITYNTFVLV